MKWTVPGGGAAPKESEKLDAFLADATAARDRGEQSARPGAASEGAQGRRGRAPHAPARKDAVSESDVFILLPGQQTGRPRARAAAYRTGHTPQVVFSNFDECLDVAASVLGRAGLTVARFPKGVADFTAPGSREQFLLLPIARANNGLTLVRPILGGRRAATRFRR